MWTVLLVSALGSGDVGDVSFSSADFGDEEDDDAKDFGLSVHATSLLRHLRLLLPSDKTCGPGIVRSAHGEQEWTMGYGLEPLCEVAMARGLTITATVCSGADGS